ncbi:MAG: hypothetical protein ISS79_12300 [Phycisphaerae bacterium]|nr:hypothetical protein [Phycisphaerae bacterium]
MIDTAVDEILKGAEASSAEKPAQGISGRRGIGRLMRRRGKERSSMAEEGLKWLADGGMIGVAKD